MHSLNTSNHVPRLDLGFISWEARLGKIFSLMENTKLNLDLELMLGYAYQINKRYQQNTGEGNRYVITGQDHTILDDEIQFFDLTTYKTKNAHFGIVSTSLIVEIFSKSQIPHRFSLGFDYYVGFQPIVEHVYGPASELLVFSSRGSGAQLTIGYHLSILDLFKGAKKKRNERYQKGKSTFFFL
jgi:recombinational DNA repair protein RecT